jgi:uncharacterized protein Yka (UPF0111/DUF47 family)
VGARADGAAYLPESRNKDESDVARSGWRRIAAGKTAEHAMLVTTLGDRMRRALMRLKAGLAEDVERTAELAKEWETRADDIVRRTVRSSEQAGERPELRRLITEAHNAADALEDTAFLLTFIGPAADATGIALLDELSDVVARYAKGSSRKMSRWNDFLRTT